MTSIYHENPSGTAIHGTMLEVEATDMLKLSPYAYGSVREVPALHAEGAREAYAAAWKKSGCEVELSDAIWESWVTSHAMVPDDEKGLRLASAMVQVITRDDEPAGYFGLAAAVRVNGYSGFGWLLYRGDHKDLPTIEAAPRGFASRQEMQGFVEGMIYARSRIARTNLSRAIRDAKKLGVLPSVKEAMGGDGAGSLGSVIAEALAEAIADMKRAREAAEAEAHAGTAARAEQPDQAERVIDPEAQATDTPASDAPAPEATAQRSSATL